MHVLHFLPAYVPAWQYGGPILSVSRLCEGLVSQGVDVSVITTNAGLPHFPSDQLGVPHSLNGVNVTYYPVDSCSRVIRSKSLLDSVSAHMNWADIFHLSSIWQPLGIPVQSAAHRHHIPVIQTLRGALGPYSWRRGTHKKVPYYLLKEMSYLQRAAAIHCTTDQEAREINWLHLKPPIERIPNPLALDNLYSDNESRNEWRDAHRIKHNETLFIIAGRLHHKKGLELLPQLLQVLHDKPWRLAIIGNDADGTGHSLRNTFDKLNLTSRCLWFDSMPSSDLLAPLNAADWLLLPSRHENFGNIAVEALSCGCGVLLSDRVGVTDLLLGCPGVLSAVRTKSSWLKMLQHSLATSRPGRSSEAWVQDKFSQETIAKLALSMYYRVLNYA